MSTSTLGVGVPVPKMLPIIGTWTFPFAAYLVLLSNRVVQHRMKNEKWIGDRLPAQEGSKPADSSDDPDPLLLNSRTHQNFLENVPIAFVLATAAELNGANRKYLNYAMATFFALRIVHVEFGMKGKETVAWGRPLGHFGTQGFLVGLAAWNTWLVKGYWGY